MLPAARKAAKCLRTGVWLWRHSSSMSKRVHGPFRAIYARISTRSRPHISEYWPRGLMGMWIAPACRDLGHIQAATISVFTPRPRSPFAFIIMFRTSDGLPGISTTRAVQLLPIYMLISCLLASRFFIASGAFVDFLPFHSHAPCGDDPIPVFTYHKIPAIFRI